MVAWQVDATTFKSILMSKSKADAHDYASFIKEVPLLKSLSKEDVRSLLDALEEQAFAAGQQVHPTPNPNPNPNQDRNPNPSPHPNPSPNQDRNPNPRPNPNPNPNQDREGGRRGR